MAVSNSVIRRYTPPTCTLEIVAKSSPLSRWMGRQVVKQPRFQLSFDDPRVPEEKRVTIRGDRDQLEVLSEAVATYVQDLLNQSPDRLNAAFAAPLALSSEMSSAPGTVDLNPDDAETRDLASLQEPLPLEPSPVSAGFNPAASNNPTAAPFGKIFLQPGRWLTHDLFLGSLANEDTGSVIQLTVLQLFDLATALDEYAADLIALPNLNGSRSAAVSPAWAKIAALALLTVGLTTAVVRVLNYQSASKQQTAKNTAPQASNSNDPAQIALQPAPPLGVPTPLLSSPEALPTPPLGAIIPSPVPSPSGAVINVPQTTQLVPGAPGKVIPPKSQTFPSISPSKSPQTTFNIDSGSAISTTKPTFNQPYSTQTGPVFVPGNAVPKPSASLPSYPPLAVSPSVPPSTEKLPNIAVSPLPSFSPISPAPDSLPPQESSIATPSPESSNQQITAARGDDSNLRVRELLRSNQTPPATSTPTTTTKPNTTAFDITPQVAEARTYFQKNWQPPDGMTQTLEYSLTLSVDGTIQMIMPLGQAARQYIDRSGMPLIGEPFVSPSKNGQAARIRVVLSPDGKVQTFAE